MKREPKPFVVEVKRGGRRSSFVGQLDLAEPMSDAVKRAERALFAGTVTDALPPKPTVPEPLGRVLPSLIEPKPIMVAETEEPAKRRGRKPGSKNKPKVKIVAPGADVPVAHLGQDAPSGSRTIAGTSPRRQTPDASAERAAMDFAPIDTGKAVADGDAPAASGEPGRGERTRLRNRSSILARYVFETEPMPGERWKRPGRRTPAWRRDKARVD